jgi:hypothetical protein
VRAPATRFAHLKKRIRKRLSETTTKTKRS